MGYYDNRKRARTETIGVTKTDQSQRELTDINVIVRNLGMTGQMQGHARAPIYADFSALPEDLRGFLEMGKELQEHRANLPEELQHLDNQQIVDADPRELARIINGTRTAKERRAKLPKHLQTLSDNAILELTEEQLTHIITPSQPKPAEPPK